MTTATRDFTSFTGKKVKVVLGPDAEGGENRTVEGKVELGTPQGIMLKAKGKTDLLRGEEIIDISELADAPKLLKAKSLKPVDVNTVKSHVLERHGATLAYVNQTSAEDVFTWHSQQDHVALDLGHVHAAPAAEGEIAKAEGQTAGE